LRKIVSIVLLACLIAPFLGSYIWVQIKQSQIRKEVKWKMIAGIDKKELVFMTFSIKDSQEKLNWKHSKEFEYKGEWYDIVEQEIIGDSIHYYLWWDHDETQLNKQLNELIALTVDQNPLTKENNNKVAKLFKSLYFTEEKVLVKNEIKSEFFQPSIFYNSTLVKVYYSIDLPPPDLA
jgi:hypothetical protein